MSSIELNNAGNIAIHSNRYKDAIRLYSAALSIEPENIKYYSNRAAAYILNGDFEDALKDADRCLTLNPNSYIGYNRKACAYMGMNKFKEAVEYYDQSAKLQGPRVTSTTTKGRTAAKKMLEKEEENSKQNNQNDMNSITTNNTTVSTNKTTSNTESDNTNNDPDDVLNEFFNEVVEAVNPPQKQEKRLVDDTPIETSTPVQQLNRLLQVNYKWKNLNPFVVLMLPEEATREDIKQRYYKLSSLIHPDRCKDPRAREGFEIVKKAAEELLNEERRTVVVKLIKGAKKKVDQERKKLIADGMKEYMLGNVLEQQRVEIAKTFADAEQRRLVAERNKIKYAQKAREEEHVVIQEEKKKEKKNKKWGDHREERVESWRNFTNSKKRRIISKAIELPKEEHEKKIVVPGDEYKTNWR